MTTYQVIDAPKNGSVGQDCGIFVFADLPARVRAAVEANPTDNEWTLPALSGGDTGEELTDMIVVVTRIDDVE